MTENVVVDFSRVEEGLKLVARAQGLAVERERVNTASVRAATAVKVIGYCAAACALVIVSIGVAIWLARKERVAVIGQSSPPTRDLVNLLLGVSESRSATSAVPNKIMTKVVQFNSVRSKDFSIANPFLTELAAGHEYSTSNADQWDSAWCYAHFRRDGITYSLTLEKRLGTVNRPATASEAERRLLDLSDDDLALLRARCPWKSR